MQLVNELDTGLDVLGSLNDMSRRAWGHDPGLTINQTLAQLVNPRVNLVVNVKLVGFHGDGCAPTPGERQRA